MTTLSDIAILLIAAFGAGVLNTIAGGGTFLTFPALVFTGMPPVAANATSAVAVFPGYLAGAFGFRDELGGFDRKRLLRLSLITLAGGVVGSGLLLVCTAWLRPLASELSSRCGGRLTTWRLSLISS